MTAILVPGVNHRLLPGKSRTPLQPQVITIHTMVWSIDPCEDYFRRAGNPYSHLGTGHDGEVRQWQDLQYRAASDLHGNPYNISVENADTGPGFPRWSGSDVPPFTDAQEESLVVVLSWLCHRFQLPTRVIGTSCPHERGVGYHRLGVNPYRNTTCGRLWSSARGKACPGDRRIHQLVHEILPAVASPVPNFHPSEEDDMTVHIAWLRPTAGSDENMHCYRFTEAGVATWMPTMDHINLQAFLGAKWSAPLDPVVWEAFTIVNGPLRPEWKKRTQGQP